MTENLHRTLLQVVRAAGPLTYYQLADQLHHRGFDLTTQEFVQLMCSEAAALCGTVGPDEELIVAMDLLLAGRTFTHRLTALDIKLDALPVWPDFAHLYSLFATYPFDRIDGYLLGRAVRQDRDFSDIALLQPGTFDGREPGSLIGLRFELGRLEVIAVPAAAEPPERVRRELASRFDLTDDELDDGLGTLEIAALIRQLCFRYPTLFNEPLLPVGELLAELGLEVQGNLVAPLGGLVRGDIRGYGG